MSTEYINDYKYTCSKYKFQNEHIKSQHNISIIIVSSNTPIELYFVLKTINDSLYKDFEVIVIDSLSNKYLNKKILIKLDINITYIKIYEKSWVNKDLEFNIGMKYANGKYIILQSGVIVHLGNILSHIINYYEKKENKNMVCIYPVLELLREKDNNNLLYNLYNKTDNTLIRNIVAKDKLLFMNGKSKRYRLNYINFKNTDNNYFIVMPRHIMHASRGFDHDFALFSKPSILQFINKIKHLTNYNIRFFDFYKKTSETMPFAFQLWYKKDESKNTEIDLYNDLIEIKSKIWKQQFLHLKPEFDVKALDNIIRIDYHENENYGKNFYDFFHHKYMRSLFAKIYYNKSDQSFNYKVNKSLVTKQKNIIRKTGIYFTIYSHFVDNKKYLLTFDAKGNSEQTIGKHIIVFNTTEFIKLDKLTDKFKSYELEFIWNNVTTIPGQPEIKYYINIENIDTNDHFAIKNPVLQTIF